MGKAITHFDLSNSTNVCLLDSGLLQVQNGAVPCCVHDSFVLDITESANADGIQISSQDTAIPNRCLHTIACNI